MIPRHIETAKNLQTKHRAICEGFLLQALQKSEKAIPFVDTAKSFYKALSSVKNIDDVLSLSDFRDEIISACGFSDKAKSKLTENELDEAIKKVLHKVFREGNDSFKEELLYRYLLTKGDALGGSMRNLTGAVASSKLLRKIIEKLSANGHKVRVVKSKTDKIQQLQWENRMLLFDVKPKLIGKNIDVILLRLSETAISGEKLIENPASYIACGELKGGIDPAGADEHWKTANSALGRIRSSFSLSGPALFFIGAAIEASMAEEIFRQLQEGLLSHAANLTEEAQVDDLVDWLTQL